VPLDASEPAQDGERRVVVRKNAELPAVLIGYHGVRATDPDRPVLDVVEQLLSNGDSSRLHEDLVRAHEVATVVEASKRVGRRAGPLLDLRSGAAQEDGGGSGGAHRRGAGASC